MAELTQEEIEIKKNTNSQENEENSNGIIVSFFEKLFIFFYNYCRSVGLYTKKIYKSLYQSNLKGYHKRIKKLLSALDRFVLLVQKKASRMYKGFLYSFYAFARKFVDAKNAVKKGYNMHPKKNRFVRSLYAVGNFLKGIYNNRRILKTCFNYALPLAAICGFMWVFTYVSGLTLAVSVQYKDEDLGYIQNEAVFEEAEAKLQQRIKYLENDSVIDDVPRFAIAVVDKDNLKSAVEMTDAMIQSTNADVVKATGITIDGKFYGAVERGEVIENTLNILLNKHRSSREGETVQFTKAINTEVGLYMRDNIIDEQDVIELFNSSTEEDVYYTIESGDTPIIIAAKNDMTLDELVALNPNVMESCVVGKQLLVNKEQPFLPVSTKRQETYDVDVNYNTVYFDDAKRQEGLTAIKRAGKKGKNRVTANIEYIDGVEVSREIISEVVLTEPVTQEVWRGTKKIETIVEGAPRSEYGLVWPVTGNFYISSPYGKRGGGFHQGIDISYPGGAYGRPIRAALPGTVVIARKHSSYGNYVVIDHGGGYRTLYAHASKLVVKKGQYVKQGEHIANIGNTGYSFGAHLHFEVQINGSQKNPVKYLP